MSSSGRGRARSRGSSSFIVMPSGCQMGREASVSTKTLLLATLCIPGLMFVCHIVAYRLLTAAGRRPTAHTSAMAGMPLSVAAVHVVVVLAAWQHGLLLWDVVAQLIYVACAGAAFAILYLDAVNIAETSLHMHLLLRVTWGERRSLQRLIEQYSADHIVEERLQRLTALGQVRHESERYYLRDQSVLRLATVMD